MKKIIASYGVAEGLAKGLNVLLLLVLAALVDVDSFGEISLLVALELLLIEMLLVGQNTTLLRYFQAWRQKISRLYAASLTIILFSALFVFATVFVISMFTSGDSLWRFRVNDLFALVAAVALYSHTVLYLAFLRAEERIVEYCLLRITFQVVKFSCVVLLVLTLNKPMSYPLGLLCASGLVALYAIRVANSRTRGYSALIGDTPKPIRDNLLVGLPLALHTVAGVLYSVIDRFFLAALLDQSNLAIYSFAATQGNAIFFALNVFALAFVPVIFKQSELNEKSAKVLRKFLLVSLLGTFTAAVAVFAVVFPVSLHFVDPAYEAGRGVLFVILTAMVLQSFSLFAIYKLTLLERVRGIPLVTLCALATNAMLNYSLIPVLGIQGAAVSALASQLLSAVLMNVTAARAARIEGQKA